MKKTVFHIFEAFVYFVLSKSGNLFRIKNMFVPTVSMQIKK